MKSSFRYWALRLIGAMVLGVVFSGTGYAVTFKVIGEIESVYLQRASMRVLEVPDDASGTSPLEIGQKVSFNLPPHENKRRRENARTEYGKVYEVQLVGSPITEYGVDEGKPQEAAPAETKREVFVWTATAITRVKNQKKYQENSAGSGNRKGKRKKGKEKEPVKIWTQTETVRGQIVFKKDRVYVKESGLRPKDLGLQVVDPSWVEKMKVLEGQTLVMSGITHRTSAASGTFEVESVIKIYQK